MKRGREGKRGAKGVRGGGDGGWVGERLGGKERDLETQKSTGTSCQMSFFDPNYKFLMKYNLLCSQSSSKFYKGK